jgi:cyclophilin family peptidyl-prolyl cis-trans isomerase
VVINIILPFDPAKHYTAVIKTPLGEMTVDLHGDVAPATVRNFVDLARQGFYDGLTFHYVRPGDLILGGDPAGDGTGGSGFNVPPEFNNRKHVVGSVGLARGTSPGSGSSQFYICLAPQPERDGLFTLFGQVVEGLDVLKRLAEVPTTGQRERPYFHPLEPLRIEGVTIREEARPATGP